MPSSQFCDQDIRKFEGYRSYAYADPLTGGEPWTCGFGTTSGVTKDTVFSLAQAVQEEVKYRQQVETALLHALPWIATLDPFRVDVLVIMAYQLGVHGTLEFKGALSACEAGDYAEAAAQMLNSEWAKQTPSRAQTLAEQMRTGLRNGVASPAQSNAVAQFKAAIGA